MRYSKEHKRQTHEKMIESAARRFRAQGFDGLSIGDLMADLHLTHGGFYRHFSSKESLYAAALAFSVHDVQARLADGDAGTPTLREIISAYLSMEHCAGVADGCPVASLSAEVARQSPDVRAAFERALLAYMEKFLPLMSGSSEEERTRQFLVLFSGMAGALSVARAVTDEALRASILESARDFYLRTYCE